MNKVVTHIGIFAIVLSGLVASSADLFAQQDAQYSQYMFNRILINPAYAGNRNIADFGIGYRTQWVSMKHTPRTAVFTAQLPVAAEKAGLAAEVFSDQLGPRSGSGLLLSYAYRMQVGRGNLSFGLKGGVVQYRYDLDLLEFKDEADVYNTNNSTSKISANADFGCLYYTNTFYAGLSATHLNRGRMSDFANDSSRLARHIFFETGKAFRSGSTVINPVLLIKKAFGAPSSVDLGLNALFKDRWWVGASYRFSYGMVFLSQFEISEPFRIGYSIDLGSNAIGRVGGVSHEIMLKYQFNVRGSKISMPRYL